MFVQLQNLSENAGNPAFDGIVRGAAENITKTFLSYYNQVKAVREQNEYQFNQVDIPRVNDILASIKNINQHIRNEQVSGNNPLELLDGRNLLLDELSEYMKIDVRYEPVEVALGVFVEDVYIDLVSDAYPPSKLNLLYNQDVITLRGTINPSTGNNAIYYDDGYNYFDISDRFTSGGLKGVLDMLNKSGVYDHPPSDIRGIGFYEKALDSLAFTFAKIFNDANHYYDYSLNPKYDPLYDVNSILNAIKEINDKIADPATTNVTALINERKVLTDRLNTFMNVTVENDDENDLVTDFRIIMTDDDGTDINILIHGTDPLQFTSNIDPDTEKITVSYSVGGIEGTVTDSIKRYSEGLDNPKYILDLNVLKTDHPLFTTTDGKPLNAGNMKIADDWANNTYGITGSLRYAPVGANRDQTGAQDNIVYMLSLFDTKLEFKRDDLNIDSPTIFNGTFEEFMKYMTDILALDINSTDTISQNHELVLNSVWDMRDAVSAVSMDEEGVNLLRYKKSYDAAARLMTTLDEALDTIINRMGLVGR